MVILCPYVAAKLPRSVYRSRNFAPELPAFQRAVAVRSKGAEAKELADTYFFETPIRVHRAGEGVPYCILKTLMQKGGLETLSRFSIRAP